MMMCRITLLFSRACTAPGQAAAEQPGPVAQTMERQGTSALTATPIIRLDKSGDMKVRFELKNSSNTDFRYLGGHKFDGALGW